MNSTLFADRLKGLEIALAQIPPRGEMNVFFGDQEYIHRKSQVRFIPSEELSRPASRPVSLNSVPDFSTRDHGHPGMGELVAQDEEIKISSSGAYASSIKVDKILFLANSFARAIAFGH
jgi:hypothetical protein